VVDPCLSDSVHSPRVAVRTGARLHFGPLASGVTSGRQFGGLGVMVEEPGLEVVLQHSVHDQIIASESWVKRIRSTLERVRNRLPGEQLSGLRIELPKSPYAHCGFGSGTQLALAIAAGICRVTGRSVPPAVELAGWIERGARSALGIHGFDEGGFLLEAGKLPNQPVGCLVVRAEMPHDWRWVLVRPRSEEGISGGEEVSAFGSLPPMSSALTDALCGLAVREIVPAIKEANFELFSQGLWEYGQRVGEYFAPVQGGVFAHSQMRQLAGALRERGVVGIAQTSWGPTLAVIQPHTASATELVDWIRQDPVGGQCDVSTTGSLNHGVSIRIVDRANHEA